MIFIETIQYSLAIVVGLLLSYQMLLSFFALKGRKTEDLVVSANRKFAVVLFVNSPNQILTRSLYSLSSLVYPKNLYDLIVVVENHDEKTEAIANKLGASTIKCPKGADLAGEVILSGTRNQTLEHSDYDAVIIVESNSLVSGNYLEVMNYYLEKGSHVIQSCDSELPRSNNGKVKVGSIERLFSNYVKPLGRKMLGLPQLLSGNGVCISTDVLQKEPWHIGVTEITEYGIQLQMQGININFAPEASVWTVPSQEEVEDKKLRDRTPLKKGYGSIQRYIPNLFSAIIVNRSMRLFDILVEIVTPSLKNIMLFVVGMGLLSVSAWGVGWIPLSFFWLWLVVAGLGVIYLLVGLSFTRSPGILRSVFPLPISANWSIKKLFTGDNKKQKPQQEERDIISGELEEL